MLTLPLLSCSAPLLLCSSPALLLSWYIAEVEAHERDILEVNRSIEALHKDTVKLNGLITLKRGEQEGLQQSNILVESDFVNTLKVRGWMGWGMGEKWR